MAHKAATALYARERTKKEQTGEGMSAQEVRNTILKDYDWCPSVRTIQRYKEMNLAGCSPMKMGPEGKVPKFIFDTLCSAFSSMININQINGRDVDNVRKELAVRVSNCMGIETVECSLPLLRRLMAATAIDLLASKSETAEDRRIKWTTYDNLKTWFGNWSADLVELGFAEVKADGDVVIPEAQLNRIINMDETCLSLDGSNGNRGGRPEVTFYNPNLPRTGRATSKSGKTTTMITGSTAAGEALPPHFQFQTAAQSDDTMRLRNEMIEWMPGVSGKFGHKEEVAFPCTFGMNTKGGMDNEEFEEYTMTAIVPLYPDARDVDGLRVMMKADSGPGRDNCTLLAKMRHLGFILYPGVPNTTAVTQETDRNYGPFKTQFRLNLDAVVQARIRDGKSTSLQPWLVGLCVFGGRDPLTKLVIEIKDSAFEVGFSEDACIGAWEKIGAAPLTRKCLSDSKVRRELGDADDDMNALMIGLQEANDVATALLIRRGFDGTQLAVTVNQVRKKKNVTVPHSKERYLLLAKAKSHGEKFTATGGSHLTSDDFFKSLEVPVREKEIAEKEKDKEHRLLMARLEQESRSILCLAKAPGNTPAERGAHILTSVELEVLLKRYCIPAKDVTNKALRLAKWKAILQSMEEPPAYSRWSEDDEAELDELRKMEISIGDTALGRHRATMKQQLFASVTTLSPDERQSLKAEIETYAEEDGPEMAITFEEQGGSVGGDEEDTNEAMEDANEAINREGV